MTTVGLLEQRDPERAELRRMHELLRLLGISRLRALSRDPQAYARACRRHAELVRQYNAEAARTGAPEWHRSPVEEVGKNVS